MPRARRVLSSGDVACAARSLPRMVGAVPRHREGPGAGRRIQVHLRRGAVRSSVAHAADPRRSPRPGRENPAPADGAASLAAARAAATQVAAGPDASPAGLPHAAPETVAARGSPAGARILPHPAPPRRPIRARRADDRAAPTLRASYSRRRDRSRGRAPARRCATAARRRWYRRWRRPTRRRSARRLHPGARRRWSLAGGAAAPPREPRACVALVGWKARDRPL